MVNDSFATNGSGNGIVYEPSLVNGIVFITISNYPILNNYSTNASETKDTFVKDHNGIFEQVLSNSDETNPNGVFISSYIRKYRDNDGSIWMEYNLLFQDNQGLIYHITVSGDVSKNSQINETATEVFNTLTTSSQTSVNNNTQNTQSIQNNSMISASQAKAIANEYESKDNLEASGYVGFVDVGDGNPYYHVDLKYKNASSSDNQEVAYVTIYAKTGTIRS
jgi:hypothetical protein